MTTAAADTTIGTAADNNVLLVDDEDGSDNDNDSASCPLFMIGLSRDFSQNASLAALASLLEVPEEEDSSSSTTRDVTAAQHHNDADSSQFGIAARLQRNVPPTVPSSRTRNPVLPRGGGKVRSDKTRKLRQRHDPYSTVASAAATTAGKASLASTGIDRADTATTPSSSTVGEAQLFLQMWKL